MSHYIEHNMHLKYMLSTMVRQYFNVFNFVFVSHYKGEIYTPIQSQPLWSIIVSCLQDMPMQ